MISLCYNTGPYLLEALESLRVQTYDCFEVIVVDDGSSDNSVAMVQSWIETSPFPIRLIEKKRNSGIPAAFNTGVASCKGAIVTWLSDDVWDAKRLAWVVETFEGLPDDVTVLFGDAIVIDAVGEIIGELKPPESLVSVGVDPGPMAECGEGAWVVLDSDLVRRGLLSRCFIPAPAAAVRRTCYDIVGFYDESLPGEDLDFWLRASKLTGFAYLRVPLAYYRRHDRNHTLGLADDYLGGLQRVLKKHEELSRDGRRRVARHVREEAYRVANGLLESGHLRLALSAIRRYYIPNLRWTVRSIKETVRLGLAIVHAVGFKLTPSKRNR